MDGEIGPGLWNSRFSRAVRGGLEYNPLLTPRAGVTGNRKGFVCV